MAHAASVAGIAGAITATFSLAFTAYAAKVRFRFAATGANTIKKLNGVALATGDIAGRAISQIAAALVPFFGIPLVIMQMIKLG